MPAEVQRQNADAEMGEEHLAFDRLKASFLHG